MTTRILYVDDRADIRQVATMSLELDPDFEVRNCSSGVEAIEEARSWRPDLILLDVMMPQMDGRAVLQKLGESPETADIKVVFITALAMTKEVEALKALGVAGVITKPFDPMTLAEQVREHL